jgi:hypothetical protein
MPIQPQEQQLPIESFNTPPGLKNKLPFTQLDVEYGGTINHSYTTKIGNEVKTIPTTQPYTPKNTYADSFTGMGLDNRLKDLYK